MAKEFSISANIVSNDGLLKNSTSSLKAELKLKTLPENLYLP